MPAVVAVVNYTQLLMVDGWRILLVIALSTTLVLGATAQSITTLHVMQPQAEPVPPASFAKLLRKEQSNA